MQDRRKKKSHTLLILAVLLRVMVQFCHGKSMNSSTLKFPFTCNAGIFQLGQRAEVTCNFGSDIHNPRYHFEVVLYQANDSTQSRDVLRCFRISKKFRCSTGEGYSFENLFEDNVRVIIPSVTRQYAGKYVCQLIPSDGRGKRPCDLRVEDGLTLLNESSTQPPGSVSSTLDWFHHLEGQITTAVCVFVILLMILSIVLAVHFWRQKKYWKYQALNKEELQDRTDESETQQRIQQEREPTDRAADVE